MNATKRLKIFIAFAFAAAFAASLAGGAGADAQQKPKPGDPRNSSFTPVIEEPFDVVLRRDKAAKQA